MALHNLRIVVVDGGRSNNYSANSNNNSTSGEKSKNYKDTPLYKMLNAKDTIKSGMSPATLFAMDMGLRVASQSIKQGANYVISDIGRANGDSNYQAYINRQIESITDPLSLVSGTLSGAATGSMFGPIGAGVGAVAGLLSSGISLGFKYAERQRAYQHEMFKENTSQAYNLARANYSAFTGRVR